MPALSRRAENLFAADSFGALFPDAVEETGDIGGDAPREGLVNWSSIDAPWLVSTDRDGLGCTLSAIERLDPDVVLSGHLPAARGDAMILTRIVAYAYVHRATPANDALSLQQLAATPGEPASRCTLQSDAIEMHHDQHIIDCNRRTVERLTDKPVFVANPKKGAWQFASRS